MADRAQPITRRAPLRERPLFSGAQALELERLFRTLANETRLRLLHALERGGEVCVSDLAALLEMTPQAVSNQLQRLADRQVVAARRDGNRIFYRLLDPCVKGLLDLGVCLVEENQKRLARKATATRREATGTDPETRSGA